MLETMRGTAPVTCAGGRVPSRAAHARDLKRSIVSCRMAGFQPLAAGSRGALVWGSGTYFAREARKRLKIAAGSVHLQMFAIAAIG
eukprot:Skav206810  [mRNA]  locus=scaffold1990:357350:359157:- [translate_table: standard]